MADAELVFCTDLAGVPEARAEYAEFWHEAEVFFYPLANAVEAGSMTAEEAREAFAPYRNLVPWLYDPEEMEEHENGFPSTEWFADWGPGPGSEDFWREADALGIPGVVYSEGDHPGGSPYFEVRRRGALSDLRERLKDRYEIVVMGDLGDYDTSASADPEEARGIIERARGRAAGPSGASGGKAG